MKILLNKDWDYTLYQTDDKLIISIVCGGAGVFETNIKLNEDEKLLYKLKGEDYIEELAGDIQYSPAKYKNRHIDLKY
jgi:hypothetical protein